MAKKSTKKAPPKKKPTGVKAVAKSLAKTIGAASTELDEEAIGHAAGEVWNLLHAGGPQSVSALKKLSTMPGEITVMAVGWLAREGKLHFDTSGRSVKVSLRG
ncbi:MAG: winged helix-turn-helix domain-containing protein [Planctomycetota bacterium]